MSDSDLSERLHQAAAAYAALPPYERAVVHDEQQRSWVFAQTGRWPPTNPFRARIEQLERELSSAEARALAAEQDAKRYRWLLNKSAQKPMPDFNRLFFCVDVSAAIDKHIQDEATPWAAK